MISTSRGDAYFQSLYATDPDFRQLAQQDADFRAILKTKYQLDFTDPAAVKQLTKTLLALDFGLRIELPDDRLCPPVPNRHNYILWLKSLLDSSSYNEPGGKLSGLDIGTGASCIYPLLGCAQRPWSFIATEVDHENLKHAAQNVALNNLQDRIKIVARTPTDPMVPLDELGLTSVDFVMTNPPFYASEADMLRSAAKKARPPHSACTGAPVEMVCDGGEVAFVSRILDESLALRGRVRWYTAMLGLASSLEAVVEALRARAVGNYAVAEFVQGSKTRRWAVAWSFGAGRPRQDVCRGMRATPWRRVLPPVVETDVLTFPLGDGDGEGEGGGGGGGGARAVGEKADALAGLMAGLELTSWEWDREALLGVGRARENVWSRAWRRKRKREEAEGGSVATVGPVDSEVCVFGFSVSITVKKTEAVVACRWREGHDESIYTSFCGFVKTRLQGQQQTKPAA